VRILRRAEIRAVEDFLKAEDLDAPFPGLFDERNVASNRVLTDLLDWQGWIAGRGRALNQTADDFAGHRNSSSGYQLSAISYQLEPRTFWADSRKLTAES
jgi:hypothetical protein